MPGSTTPGRAAGPAVSPEPIVQVAAGFMAAKQLFAASAAGLFAALSDGPLPLSELAAAAGIAEQSCRILADSMVGLGLMARDGAGYANGEAAAEYLAGKPGALDLRPHMAFWNGISYPHWLGFDKTAREALPNELDLSGDRMTEFFGGVQAYNSAHALMLDEHYDFGVHERVLDLAGLSGAFLAAAVDRHPDLRGTFFADPQMVEFARPGLEPRHLERIELIGGDAAADPLPEGHDAVLLEHVVHRFDAEANRALLRRARDVVKPGAKLLVLDFFLDEGEPRRALDSLLAGEYLTIDGTVVYPEAEVRSWVADTGWRWLETRLLPGSPRVLIAEAV